MEDEIEDLKCQLKHQQEQKYEACRGLEREWSERMGEAKKAFEAEKMALEATVKEVEERLKVVNGQLDDGKSLM